MGDQWTWQMVDAIVDVEVELAVGLRWCRLRTTSSKFVQNLLFSRGRLLPTQSHAHVEGAFWDVNSHSVGVPNDFQQLGY
jgi:hypothetical protein